MKKKSIGTNYLYNMLYQILLIIAPLVTTPYTARVLGADNVGNLSFVMAINTYFMIATVLGTNAYGQREIAYLSGDTAERSKMFWEILILRLLNAGICILAYSIVISCSEPRYRILFIILIINIVSNALDISWFYQGLEEFRITVTRQIAIKIVGIIATFIFVKERGDIAKYALVITVPILLGNISLFLNLRRYITHVSFKQLRPYRHFLGTIALFLPQVAVSLYSSIDKVMLGFFSSSGLDNGYYEQATKIFTLCLCIVIALSTVTSPRIAACYAEKKDKELQYYLQISVRYICFIGIPLMFGVMATATNFVPWFFGNEYIPSIILVRILAPLIFIMGLSNLIGYGYLVATSQQKLYTITVFVGTVTNFILNYFLIPIFQAPGASIASVFAETIVLFIQLYCIRKQISVKNCFACVVKYFLAGLVMFLVVICFLPYFASSIINTLFLAIIGACTYILGLIILRDDFFLNIINRLRGLGG